METVLKNLKLRRFDAYCVANKEEAKALALSFIKPDDKVGYGGSMTLYQIGILDELRKDGRCHLVDRDLASTPEDSLAYNMEAKDADVYLGSANAISETGTIFQTDGRGNRVSTMIFGAKSVILIVGKNKIVPTDEEARQTTDSSHCRSLKCQAIKPQHALRQIRTLHRLPIPRIHLRQPRGNAFMHGARSHQSHPRG